MGMGGQHAPDDDALVLCGPAICIIYVDLRLDMHNLNVSKSRFYAKNLIEIDSKAKICTS